MTAEDGDRIRQLGYPWETLADSEMRFLQARQFAELALECGTADERLSAQIELHSAAAERDRARSHVADAMLMMLDCASKYAMHELFGKIMAVAVAADWRKSIEQYMAGVPGTAQHLLWTLGKVDDRLDQLEYAVANLEQKGFPRVAR